MESIVINNKQSKSLIHSSGDIQITASPHPFRIERDILYVPSGSTINEIVNQIQPDSILRNYTVVFVRGERISPQYWPYIRLKPGTHLEICIVPKGGGGKNPLRTILAIATVAAAFAFGPALGASLAGFETVAAATAAEATILGVGFSTFGTGLIGLSGLLLTNVVAPVRPPRRGRLSGPGSGRADDQTLFIEGARNRKRPFSAVPVIFGKHRTVPPYGADPFTEVVGDDQRIRLLFVWGIGPLLIDTNSLKIGETPLTDFEGVEIEHREGKPGDSPITLFPDQVFSQSLVILLKQTTGYVTRTADPGADELSVDLTFAKGLIGVGNKGDRFALSVTIEIEYREVGTSPWLTPIFTAKTVPDSWISGNSITITRKKSSAVREGFRWSVTPRGTYEVRIRRTTVDRNQDDGLFDELTWTQLRAIKNEDPIQSDVPVAKTAMIIKATDQLSGVVDEFSGVVTTLGKDWDSGTQTWVDDQPIQNPASLFRHILQSNGMASPLPDSRIDLTTLQDWHEFNADTSRNFQFNMLLDSQNAVWDILADIAAAGRALPVQIDDKWSVVLEQKQSVDVSHITPRNSFDFRMEKQFADIPDGWRIRFLNENKDFRQDERIVFRDGFDETNATKFESLDLPGVTNPDQIFKLGRFRIFQGLQQPERWIFSQDMEYLTYRRGDRVAITHDVLKIGRTSGRIKSVTVDGSNNVTNLELDEAVTMEAGTNFGIAIRSILGGEITRQVNTDPGEQTTITLTTSIPPTGGSPTIQKGEIFGFGVLGLEKDSASIISIEPDNDFRAKITAVPYREVIFDADTEPVATFDSKLDPLPKLPAPVIMDVVSDESMLVLGPGQSLQTRVSIQFDPLDDPRLQDHQIDVQIRPSETGEPFFAAQVEQQTEDQVILGNVQDGETVDIRIRFRMGVFIGPWTQINNHLIVGKSTNPAPIKNPTLSIFGGQALLRWDTPDLEVDVVFGGEVRVRHSPIFTGATWSSSTSIGNATLARAGFATLPLKPGTYLIRIFDSAGNPSDIVSVSTKQASVLTFANLTTLDEDPTFGGTHTNTVGIDNQLKLAAQDSIDDWGNVDDVVLWDAEGGIVSSGTYDFLSGFDLGIVEKVRLTSRLDATIVNVLNLIDDQTRNIDEWEDFDGVLQASADVRVEVRTTDDDPNGSPVWSSWERLDSGEFEARGFDFRAILTSDAPAFNPTIDDLGIDVDKVA
ncbi:MAG: hypothetical protein GWN01_09170 [Nitrosopumilaceae archaeon]|nr:hypothetical protein [Nitrosopumilaceae archaeon]NIU87780.1 hypothetical protein [Nitrosopumilaceae archaeon]NIV65163.1 hypothetical protein [Nitrosopumilaceae archaeon]NIX61678.1 hypothetical protein [Nitrosopumilaceae archaeon]